MAISPSIRDIRRFDRDGLHSFVAENLHGLLEDEAAAVLDNPHCSTRLCDAIAQVQRLTSFHSVRVRLVAHRATPRGHALKFVHHLYWSDLLRLSTVVVVPAAVRRAIDTQLLTRVAELSLGERISSARRCSAALIKHFLADPDVRIFAAVLVNPRLREDDLVLFAASPRATGEQLAMLAGDRKWSQRRAIRRAIVTNPSSPKAVAATQLPHLTARELHDVYRHPATTVFLRCCIERLEHWKGERSSGA